MIRLNDIVVKFGDFTALHSINVHVKEGEFFTFLGPSGCGKTTTLRTLTGFIEPVSGSVVVKGKDITHVPIEERSIGIVFQSYALFPTMTVYDNIAFGLKLKKLKKKLDEGKITFADVQQAYNSWKGYINYFNSYRTLRSMDKLFNQLFNDYKGRRYKNNGKERHSKFRGEYKQYNFTKRQDPAERRYRIDRPS